MKIVMKIRVGLRTMGGLKMGGLRMMGGLKMIRMMIMRKKLSGLRMRVYDKK